jgi:hypothetical protein
MSTVAVTEAWAEAPLQQFVEDARVELALLMYASGQVLGQAGFQRRVDVMSACALAAGINATAAELGRMLDGKPFGALHYGGKTKQTFLANVETRRGNFLLFCVFDERASLGIVQLYFGEFRHRLAAAAPEPDGPSTPLNEHFEGELNRNLAALFGRP